MLGVLKGVMDIVIPRVPECEITIAKGAFNGYFVSCKRMEYTVGFVPKPIGEVEIPVARISVEFPNIVLWASNGTTYRIPTIKPNTESQWRLDDAADELTTLLKELAAAS